MRLTPGAIGWRALVTCLYAFLLAPLVVVLIVSFDTRPYLRFPPASFSLGSYVAVLGNAGFRRAALTSLGVGVIASGLSLVLGTAAALVLAQGGSRATRFARLLFLSPMLVPHIVLAVGLMVTLQPLGLLDTIAGLVLAHIGITLPYTVRIVSSAVSQLDRDTAEAARIHGATPWQTFWRIRMPALRPAIVSAGLIAFLFSFDEAVLALFIAGSRATTLPLAIFQYVQFRTDPQIAALSVIIVGITLIPVVLVERRISLRRAVGS